MWKRLTPLKVTLLTPLVASGSFLKPSSTRSFSSQSLKSQPFNVQTSLSLPNGIKLFVAQGDLTKFNGDCIVNAANKVLLGGGGVDGAIHRAAGKELKEYIKNNIETIGVMNRYRCNTSDAILTPGFNLTAEYIIHTVGPIYESKIVSQPLLKNCYINCLNVANETNNISTIAFPAISCGVYGYPFNDAMEVAFNQVKNFDNENGNNTNIKEVWFVLFSDEMYNDCKQMLQSKL